MSDIEAMVRKILEKTCETDEVFEDYDMDLVDAGYLDSFSLLNIILELENMTGVILQPTDIKLDDIKSVNGFIGFLESKNIRPCEN